MSDLDQLEAIGRKRKTRKTTTDNAAPPVEFDGKPPSPFAALETPPAAAVPAPDAEPMSAPESTPEPETDAQPSPVPGMDDRPCWKVFDDWADDGDRKLKAGVWYFGIKAGKNNAPPEPTQSWVCGPLHVTAETTNKTGGNFGRLLRFRASNGKWTEWAMPMTLLAGDGSELRAELLYMGLLIDPQHRHLLHQYLQSQYPKRRITCAEQTGWAGGGIEVFVLPDGAIGPDADRVVYQSGEHASDEFATAGTLAGWQADVAALAVGNPLLALSICAAFAGPVLHRCNAESGGVHLVGDSSTGKSTAIEAARSVWGGAGFKRSWRTTGNGLEGVAALFNDCLLALDEISEADPRDVGAIVYSLGNGKGKQRASRTGSARGVRSWRCSVLSTGERTLATTMTEGGHRIKAGQAVRLLDVPANRTHGAWDFLHQHPNGPGMSDHIKRACNVHYGHAGRAFLERLTWDESDLCEALEATKALPEFATADTADGQVKRAAARFALLALAGELATEYGVTGWPEGEATMAAGIGFQSWLTLRGNTHQSHEHGQVLAKMREFIERHADSRFSDLDNPLPPDRAALIRDRAGWYQDAHGGRVYLFTSTGMSDAMKGLDKDAALKVLERAGALIVPNGDSGKRSKTIRADGKTVRVYTVKPDALDAGGAGAA